MSTERDELATLICMHADFWDDHEGNAPEMILAAGYRKPRTITNEDELDALPVGAVVLSARVFHHEGAWPLSYQRWQDGYWHRGARSGSTHPDNFLPASVLYEPEATK